MNTNQSDNTASLSGDEYTDVLTDIYDRLDALDASRAKTRLAFAFSPLAK